MRKVMCEGKILLREFHRNEKRWMHLDIYKYNECMGCQNPW